MFSPYTLSVKNIIIIIVNDLAKEHEQWQWRVVVVGEGVNR